MDLREQPPKRRLADRLGVACHKSALYEKVRGIWSGRGEFEDWLCNLAFARGAWAYPPRHRIELDADAIPLSNEELGVCLCLPHLPENSVFVRIAAQLLSSSKTDVAKLVELARTENCAPVLAHIARACMRVESSNGTWSAVLERLDDAPVYPVGVLPDWTRFTFYTGMDRHGQERIWWLHAEKPKGQDERAADFAHS